VRLSAVGILGLLALGGCAYPAPPITETQGELDPEAGPVTEEDRVAAVLGELQGYCERNSAACAAVERPAIYPNVQVSEVERRWIDDRYQWLRTVGIEVRWDPGTERFQVLRGNTPTYRGDLRDDP
jgi:hypothetical protein